jgi:hypothetical protein
MNGIKSIFIEGTAKTPQIDFNQLAGELILFGKSIPENAAKIYEPLLDWINEYVKSPRPTSNLRFNLEYFNSASSLWFAKMVKALSKINKDDYVLLIHYYFDVEDYDNLDTEDLKDLVGSFVDNISNTKISIGLKTYAIEDQGEIVKESLIFI